MRRLHFAFFIFLAASAFAQTPTGLVSGSWVNAQGFSGLPSGLIVLLISGSCPSGFTEVAALNGQFLQGTTNANGDVGATGGNLSITPTGTVSTPTFSGAQDTTSAVSAGTPAGLNTPVNFTPAGTNSTASFTPSGTNGTTTTGATSAGTPAGTNGATATTGNCSATQKIGTSTASACSSTSPNLTVPAETFTGSALATHTHTVPAETFTGSSGTVPAETFTGSQGSVPAEAFAGSPLATHTHTVVPTGLISQPSFTGNPVDPRPLYTKVIFCSKN